MGCAVALLVGLSGLAWMIWSTVAGPNSARRQYEDGYRRGLGVAVQVRGDGDPGSAADALCSEGMDFPGRVSEWRDGCLDGAFGRPADPPWF
ncbi:hypothetical protein AB0M28_07825 [Streptomyces sp. NPDC051940]|uniref:hypothetical protein n=1 Tax=Streptomyces sp. NPDC051940 TaxID=3155675 RepID=UPI00342E2B30